MPRPSDFTDCQARDDEIQCWIHKCHEHEDIVGELTLDFNKVVTKRLHRDVLYHLTNGHGLGEAAALDAMVIVDSASRFLQVYPIVNQTTATLIETLNSGWFLKYEDDTNGMGWTKFVPYIVTSYAVTVSESSSNIPATLFFGPSAIQSDEAFALQPTGGEMPDHQQLMDHTWEPYHVVARYGPSYQLEFADGVPFVSTVAGDLLMPYHWGDDVDPAEVAPSSTDESDPSDHSYVDESMNDDGSSNSSNAGPSTPPPEESNGSLYFTGSGGLGSSAALEDECRRSPSRDTSLQLPPSFLSFVAGRDTASQSPAHISVSSTNRSLIRGEVPDIVEVLSDSDESDNYDSDDSEYEPLSGDNTSDKSSDESDGKDEDEGTEPPLGPLAVSSIGFSGPSSIRNATTMSEMETIQSTMVCDISTAPNTCDVGVSTENMYTTASAQTNTASDMLEQAQYGETPTDNATMVGIETIMVDDGDSISNDEIRIDIVEDEEDSGRSAIVPLPQVPSPQTVTTKAPDNHIDAETIPTSDNSPSEIWAMSTAIVPYSHGYYGYSPYELAVSRALIN
ncbi:hypothetical protein COEREDRAFT_5957 [Coemansia reversa NRRL 1564]|uniref:Uncharacterized protein n=1 Tax=Coemansia reversa (strain ATCC 12441 / NRRL 1564) TaxID=763665 RepID=A0A2G5BIC9_COERN|nr:hypothetical protein COEREDRAFT_5957 [Coemansia reversa NRRL 1564]|eukprot:PIA18784.1 hypothetical protein COEREDRAFT_5957 [Coemansia reversa NRRL 1564]